MFDLVLIKCYMILRFLDRQLKLLYNEELRQVTNQFIILTIIKELFVEIVLKN